jgi:hypothetical protein
MEIMTIGFIKSVIALVTIVAITVTSWILGMRMRRRIKKSLGIEVSNEMELTSLKTWMDVENAEEKNRGGKLY